MQTRTLILSGTLIAVAAVVFLLSRLGDDGARLHPEGLTQSEQATGGLAHEAPPDADGTRSLAAAPETVRSGPRPALVEPPAGFLLTCLRAEDGEPLPGVRVYEDGAVGAGPSTAQGVLAMGTPTWGRRTLWAKGRVARRLDGVQLPQEVRFERADAELRVALLQATPQHRAVRTKLQRHGPETPPQGPWTPRLEVETWERLVARDVPPGTYDVYVWIALGEDTPKPYSIRHVVIEAGERETLTIDLVADALSTHESDS